MSELSVFGGTAKGLARNPIGIIALFIVLIYGFAALTLGLNSQLLPTERLPLVWFLVLFPVAVLVLFGWLVSAHHEKLYAPADFRSDDSFYRRREISERRIAEVRAEQATLKARVRETILEQSEADTSTRVDLQRVAERVQADIERATNITVDARDFLADPHATFDFPVAAFETLNDLTNEVYFKLTPKVRAYRYGYSWALKNNDTGAVIKNLRMLTEAPPGKPMPDPRTLSEVGILPGHTLVVIAGRE